MGLKKYYPKYILNELPGRKNTLFPTISSNKTTTTTRKHHINCLTTLKGCSYSPSLSDPTTPNPSPNKGIDPLGFIHSYYHFFSPNKEYVLEDCQIS